MRWYWERQCNGHPDDAWQGTWMGGNEVGCLKLLRYHPRCEECHPEFSTVVLWLGGWSLRPRA